jgi:hypothetical protein
MDDLDVLSRVYVKFYICQIISSVSYPIWRQGQLEYLKLIENIESSTTSNNNPKSSNEITESPFDKHSRHLFVYNEKIYSKVEILGIIVMIKNHPLTESARKILYIDDTTGVIQCIVWKNKTQNFYTKSQTELSTGTFIRILGQVDYFASIFEINVDRYQIISSFNHEMYFHLSLQSNMKAINCVDLNTNFKNEIKNKHNTIMNNSKGNNITDIHNDKTQINQNNNNNNRRYNTLKEFANKLLAFFQTEKVEVAINEMGYSKISVKNCFEETKIKGIIDEYFPYDNKEQQLKCLQDVMYLFFEQNMFGKIIYHDIYNENEINESGNSFEEADIEIKTDTKKLKCEIHDFITSKEKEEPTKGASLQDILAHINISYKNFFTIESIKVILAQMIIEKKIIVRNSNCYFPLSNT